MELFKNGSVDLNFMRGIVCTNKNVFTTLSLLEMLIGIVITKIHPQTARG
jgi:hypothetical protein